MTFQEIDQSSCVVLAAEKYVDSAFDLLGFYYFVEQFLLEEDLFEVENGFFVSYLLAYLNQRNPIMRRKLLPTIITLRIFLHKFNDLSDLNLHTLPDLPHKNYLQLQSLRMRLSPYKTRRDDLNFIQAFDFLQQHRQHFLAFTLAIYPGWSFESLTISTIVYLMAFQHFFLFERLDRTSRANRTIFRYELNAAEWAQYGGFILNHFLYYFYNQKLELIPDEQKMLQYNRQKADMVQPIKIISVFVLGFSIEGIICCLVYHTLPVAFLFIAVLIAVLLIFTQATLQYFLLEKKQVPSMIVLVLWLVLTVYCMIMALSQLIYLSEFQQDLVNFNSHLLPFMIYTKDLNFTQVAWINLAFYFGSSFSIGFYARQYYRIFWVHSIVYIYRYLKKKVKNLNETLLSGLPIIKFIQQMQNTMCSLCLEDYNDVEAITQLHCGHYYHRNCIKIWVMKSNCCPLCRRRVIYS